MRKIRLKPTESYCQKYLYTKIMTSKCKIIKYKLNANIFFQIYFCSTFSVRIQKVKINWKGRRLFERRHSKNTIWCESTINSKWPPRSKSCYNLGFHNFDVKGLLKWFHPKISLCFDPRLNYIREALYFSTILSVAKLKWTQKRGVYGSTQHM